MYPKTVFLREKERETALANYLCYLAKQISCRYYQNRRFFVLPKLVNHESRVVFFPEVPLGASFWRKFKHFTQQTFIFHYPDSVLLLAKKLLAQNPELLKESPSSTTIRKEWNKKQKQFFTVLKEFFPDLPIKKLKKIIITISPFGTVGSFFHEKDAAGNYTFFLTVREDFTAAQIAEGILTQLLWRTHPTIDSSIWYRFEGLSDFLMTHSQLGKLFGNQFVPTVTSQRDLSPVLIQESQAYLAKLGFPPNSICKTKDNLLVINNQPVYNHFTQTEKRILTSMISQKNSILSYDEIGDLFWGEDDSADKFNLYSIAKIMEKIRRKLKDCGVNQDLIYTIRGQGYMLYD